MTANKNRKFIFGTQKKKRKNIIQTLCADLIYVNMGTVFNFITETEHSSVRPDLKLI